MTTVNGDYCARSGCFGLGVGEYGGLCPKCFLELDADDRASILEPLPEPRLVLPARPGLASRFVVGALSAFGGTCGALALAKLLHWI